MKDNIILAITLACLGIFGLRSFLPAIPLSALVGLFVVAGIIGCFYFLGYSRNKHNIGAPTTTDEWLLG